MIETRFVLAPARTGGEAASRESPLGEKPPGKKLSSWSLWGRRFVFAAALLAVGVVVAREWFVEPYRVCSGSMAPTLLGPRRLCTCPRCGHQTEVGTNTPPSEPARDNVAIESNNTDGRPNRAWCPNCGFAPLPVDDSPSFDGEHVLVDKTAYLRVDPSRWDLVVLRSLGSLMIKRILGLPGETVFVSDGDAFIDGRRARKNFQELKGMRTPIWDSALFAGIDDSLFRWEGDAGPISQSRDGVDLPPGTSAQVVFRSHPAASAKCDPISDEYAYNGCVRGTPENVHDFSADIEFEVGAGKGTVRLRLFDGGDHVEAILPVGQATPKASWRVQRASAPHRRQPCKPTLTDANGSADEVASCPLVLAPRGSYHVEMAFVDRRFHVRVNGEPVVIDGDLPEPACAREGVTKPLMLQTSGVALRVRRVRLYRDVHYSQRGYQGGTAKPVPLGPGEYFVLGDNSSVSEDGRYWPNLGRTPRSALAGRPIVVHYPGLGFGDHWWSGGDDANNPWRRFRRLH